MNELIEADACQPTPRAAGTTQPAPSGSALDWIERRAKLFEAGEYPDKGVTITVENLQSLAGRFGEPVPVLIEHAESPLELGYLTSVEALGGELFGIVALTPEANSLVERSGARALSLGLTPDLLAIREISLVRNPRVESAQLFDGSTAASDRSNTGPANDLLVFAGALGEACALDGDALADKAAEVFGQATDERSDSAVNSVAEARDSPIASRQSTWRQRYERLVGEQEEREAERLVREFVAAGKLCPSQTSMAKALLLSSDTVAFDGRSRPLREVALEMIERQPRLGLFSEIAPDPAQDFSSQLLLPEEEEFYRRHFPDVSLEEIARRKGVRRKA